MAQPVENYQVIMQELVRRSNDENRRLRSVEQRLDDIEDKLHGLIDTNTERTKKVNKDIASIDVRLKDIENNIINMKTSLDNIGKQLVKFVQKRDLKEIEHMLDLISPANREKAPEEDVREVKVY